MRGEPSTKCTGEQEDTVDLPQNRRQHPGPQTTCPGRQHQQEHPADPKDTGVTQKQRSERIKPSWCRVAATPVPQQEPRRNGINGIENDPAIGECCWCKLANM